jgi:hypothetical protein
MSPVLVYPQREAPATSWAEGAAEAQRRPAPTSEEDGK